MKENLKFQLDLLESQLASLAGSNDQLPKLWQTRFAVQKAPKTTKSRSELKAEINQLRLALAHRRIHHCETELRRRLKQFKTTEALKLKRRLAAAKEEVAKSKLEDEQKCVANLDPAVWAERAVVKSLNKFFSQKLEDLSGGRTPETLAKLPAGGDNVYARAIKFKDTKTVLDTMVNEIAEFAQPEADLPVLNAKQQNKKQAKKDDKRQDSKPDIKQREDKVQSFADEEDFAGFDDVAGDVSGDVAMSDEDEDDGFIAVDEDDAFFEELPKEKPVSAATYDISDDEGPPGLPTFEQGYLSGSDDEEGHDFLSKAVQPERKNRRGQRARRKIWEQKYGARAKHVVKAETQRVEKKNHRDQKQKARAERSQNFGSAQPAMGKKPSAANIETLHPSWQAKLKAKEAQKQAKFEGKKVTFD